MKVIVLQKVMMQLLENVRPQELENVLNALLMVIVVKTIHIVVTTNVLKDVL